MKFIRELIKLLFILILFYQKDLKRRNNYKHLETLKTKSNLAYILLLLGLKGI